MNRVIGLFLRSSGADCPQAHRAPSTAQDHLRALGVTPTTRATRPTGSPPTGAGMYTDGRGVPEAPSGPRASPPTLTPHRARAPGCPVIHLPPAPRPRAHERGGPRTRTRLPRYAPAARGPARQRLEPAVSSVAVVARLSGAGGRPTWLLASPPAGPPPSVRPAAAAGAFLAGRGGTPRQ